MLVLIPALTLAGGMAGSATSRNPRLSIGVNLGLTNAVSYGCWAIVHHNAAAPEFFGGLLYPYCFGFYTRGTALNVALTYHRSSSANQNAPNTVGDNRWHHYFETYNGSIFRQYVDGVKTDTDVAFAGPLTNQLTAISVAATYWDDVRLYNRALSGTEVNAIFAGRGADEVWRGLVARWRGVNRQNGVTLANGTRIIDLSGNANHAYASNSPATSASVVTWRKQ